MTTIPETETPGADDIDYDLAAQIMPFDAFDPAYYRDPYSVYRRIRDEHGPVFRTPAGMVVVTSHDLCATAMADARFGYGDEPAVADQFVPNPDGAPHRPLIFMDPPDHTRIRALVSRAFTPRMVEKVRQATYEYAAELLREVVAGSTDGRVDLMSAFARPLPGLVLDALIDVPMKYHAEFLGMANISGRGLDPGFILTGEEKRQRDQARDGFIKAGLEMAADRLVNPGPDLISQLAGIAEDGDQLSRDELGMTLMNLLAAGFNATAALIGNASLALLRHPDQFRWLREHPDQVVNATEELLRYDSPLQMVPRTALERVEIGEVTMEPGEYVAFILGAANRDRDCYENPDRLDLSRPPSRNLGFGHGIHFCVAAPIARLTAQAALAELTKYDVELAVEEPERFPGVVLRTLGTLPATIRPTA